MMACLRGKGSKTDMAGIAKLLAEHGADKEIVAKDGTCLMELSKFYKNKTTSA